MKSNISHYCVRRQAPSSQEDTTVDSVRPPRIRRLPSGRGMGFHSGVGDEDTEQQGGDALVQLPLEGETSNDPGACEQWKLQDLIPIRDVPKIVPGRPHVSSVYRWMSPGCYGVRLRVVSIGRRRFTTLRWLQGFSEAVEAARTRKEELARPHHTPSGGNRRRRRVQKPQIVSRRTKAIFRRHGLEDFLPGSDEESTQVAP